MDYEENLVGLQFKHVWFGGKSDTVYTVDSYNTDKKSYKVTYTTTDPDGEIETESVHYEKIDVTGYIHDGTWVPITIENQCDGCNTGMKLIDGIHYTDDDKVFMVCTEYKYTRK